MVQRHLLVIPYTRRYGEGVSARTSDDGIPAVLPDTFVWGAEDMAGGRQGIASFSGAQLRRQRRQAQLRQVDLAQASGVSLGSIKAYETDARVPQVDTALKLAKALKVGLDALVDEPDGLPPGLKQLRVATGLTQEQVADQAGVGRGWYGKIEGGSATHVRPEVLGVLAEIYGVDVREVLSAHAVSRRLFLAKTADAAGAAGDR